MPLRCGDSENSATQVPQRELYNPADDLYAKQSSGVVGWFENLIDYPPSLNQGFVNFSAGVGDSLLFGFGDELRTSVGESVYGTGISGGINIQSNSYLIGEYSSIFIGGIGLYRGAYIGFFKFASTSKNLAFVEKASNFRNFLKRYTGPALFSATERAKIVPFADRVADIGIDRAACRLRKDKRELQQVCLLFTWYRRFGQ